MIKPGIYYDMSNADYHGDPDSLSSSGAKLLAREGGAALFHYQQTHPTPPSPAMEFGTAAHAWILEGKEPIIFKPGIKFEGLDGKEYTLTKGRDTKAGCAFTELQAQEHPDTPIVSQADYEHLAGMREPVHNTPTPAPVQTQAPRPHPAAPKPDLLNDTQIEGIKKGFQELGLGEGKWGQGVRFFTKGRTDKIYEMTVDEGKALARHINKRLEETQQQAPPVEDQPRLDVEVVEE